MREKDDFETAGRESGSVIVIMMMFVMVFLVMGFALYMLVSSSTSGAALERKDVKAFNVAEAGVDATMAELRQLWPFSPPVSSDDWVTVDPDEFRDSYDDETQFPDPKTGQFIYAVAYDNTPDSPTTDQTKRLMYDSNGDDRMWVDSEADVDDARHRILVMVRRVKLPVEIPDVALVANTAGGNGQGLDVSIDPAYLSSGGSIPNEGAAIVYTGKGDFNKDVSPGAYTQLITEQTNPFSSYVPDSLIGLLREMALNATRCSFFDDSNGGSTEASAFLCSADAPGSIVYLESSEDPIVIGGNTAMGTPEHPVILVVDTLNSGHAIDWRGTSAFYGVVIVVGNALLRGTQDIYGCVLSNGGVENNGGPGIKYNGDLIRRVNGQYTLSVELVPNTWEEYTVPST